MRGRDRGRRVKGGRAGRKAGKRERKGKRKGVKDEGGGKGKMLSTKKNEMERRNA